MNALRMPTRKEEATAELTTALPKPLTRGLRRRSAVTRLSSRKHGIFAQGHECSATSTFNSGSGPHRETGTKTDCTGNGRSIRQPAYLGFSGMCDGKDGIHTGNRKNAWSSAESVQEVPARASEG